MVQKLAIFGPQGSGKGTQAELLAKKFNLEYISSGNIFRQEIEAKTKLGILAQRHISSGNLVGDDLTNAMVLERVERAEALDRGFILDGYPRNKNQMNTLEQKTNLTGALVVEISDKEALRRISNRLMCICGKTYHKIYNPPKNDMLCDECSRPLFTRDDDKIEAVQRRLDIYHKETEPLYEFYEKKGILKRINGEQSIEKVHQDILGALE